jgi:hypothetical protein
MAYDRKWPCWCREQAEICGITDINIECGRRHPRLSGVCAGRLFRLTIVAQKETAANKTASDRRYEDR